MGELALDQLIQHARMIMIDDLPYYSIVDLISAARKVSRRSARNYYNVFKHRLRQEQHPVLDQLKQHKAPAADGKTYRTDFVSTQTFQAIYPLLHHLLKQQRTRITVRSADEISNLHSAVMKHYEAQGFSVAQHVRLPSKRVLDLVATRGDEIHLIECKVKLASAHFFQAVGQILCYAMEYDADCQRVIATFDQEIMPYIRQRCADLQIDLLCV